MRSIRGREAVLAAVLALLAAAPAAAGRLAVFTDGRILRVEDARLEGTRMTLILPGGGSLQVPATRVERVIADALEIAGEEPDIPADPPCDPAWQPQPLPAATPFREAIDDAARRVGLHPWLLAAVVQTESGFDPAARSPVGACGLTQLMPATAAEYHVGDVWDPRQNLRAGAELLRDLLHRFGSLPLALAAYNSGAATVERAGGVPPYRETRRFVRRVLAVFCPHVRLSMDGPRVGGRLHPQGGATHGLPTVDDGGRPRPGRAPGRLRPPDDPRAAGAEAAPGARDRPGGQHHDP